MISKTEAFADILQVATDAGEKRALIPASSVAGYKTVPADLPVKIQPVKVRRLHMAEAYL